MLFDALQIFLFWKARAKEWPRVGTGRGAVEQFLFCLESTPFFSLKLFFQIENFTRKIFVDSDLNLILISQSLNLRFELFLWHYWDRALTLFKFFDRSLKLWVLIHKWQNFPLLAIDLRLLLRSFILDLLQFLSQFSVFRFLLHQLLQKCLFQSLERLIRNFFCLFTLMVWLTLVLWRRSLNKFGLLNLCLDRWRLWPILFSFSF